VDTDESAIASFIEHARDEFLCTSTNFAFSRALEAVWSFIARVDKMISEANVGSLPRRDQRQRSCDFYRSAKHCAGFVWLLYPVCHGDRGDYFQLGLRLLMAPC